ncbi:SDR family oxidoreductase [Leptospira sp. 96542]|nr:SDR family oxidoreductase [Leptospira sp. 96542]
MKLSLVTGASTGLGKDFAIALAKKGYTPILVARSLDRLKSLAAEIKSLYGLDAIVIKQDLSKPGSAKELYNAVKKKKLSVEILVNNAGYGLNGEYFKNDFTKESEMIQLNVTSLAELCHLFLNDMVAAKNGRILNVASIASFQPGPLMANYCATKAYVLSLSESLAEEVRKYGVFVSCLCPGPTKTEFFERANMMNSKLLNFSPMTMDSETVVKAGMKALFSGQVVKIPGFSNFLIAFSVRFSPRSLVRKIAGFLNRLD